VSEAQNPDNILSASRAVSAEQAKKIADAALASKEAFGAQRLLPVGQNGLDFSLGLMKKGHIDPLAYSW
jgi:hypothetical protein